MDGTPAVHVFISYAREDTGSVLYLKDVLERAGAKIWLDQTSLSHRESDWEKPIRKMIPQAQTLIYIGSKEARKSNSVRAELRLAQDHNIPIICFWLRGNKWMDCAPFAMSESNYIDGTRERFRHGVQQLLAELGLAAVEQSALPSLTLSMHESQVDGGGEHLPSPKRLAGAQIEEALLKIQVLQTQGRIAEAIDACEQLLEKSVPRAEVHYHLGRLYQEAERWWDATTHYLVSLYDPQYAIFSCYGLGQCYRSLGDMDVALKYFDEALAQINLDLLEESDADQLLQICYEAARAHYDHGGSDAATEIFDGLLRYLESRGWTRQIKKANGLKEYVLRKRFPHILPPGFERNSRMLMGKLPQLPVNATGFFAGHGPAWPTWPDPRDADTANEASHGGVWPVPPAVRRQRPNPDPDSSNTGPHMAIPSVPPEPVQADTETRPVAIVKGLTSPTPVTPAPDAQMNKERQASTPVEEAPVDLLAQVMYGIFGPQGNLVANLDDMPLMQRRTVALGIRAVDLFIAQGKLTDACSECIDVIKAAPDYLDLYVALAEIYVRQGNIEQATQQYITFAERCLDSGRIDGAIATYRRILQLNPQNPQNLSYRNKLSELLAQEAQGEELGSAQHPSSDLAEELSSSSATPGSAQARKPSASSIPEAGAMQAGSAGASAQAMSASESPSDAGDVTASSLVDPDALPMWIFDTQVEIREAVDAMRRLRERVSAGQIDTAAQLQELAQLAQRFRTQAQLENAICVLNEIARLTPDDPGVHSELAYIYFMRSQFYKGSVELQVVAALYERRGALAEAAQVYQRMAEIAWTEHRHEDALRLQRLAIGYAADDMRLRQTIVRYYLEIEHTSEAVDQQKYIARSYLVSGKPRETIAALQKLIALDKMDVKAYEILGQAYFVESEFEQATNTYRTLQRVDPTNSIARVRLEELASLGVQASGKTSSKQAAEDEPN